MGDEADKFVSAAGHFGNKSSNLIKSYAESLGFEYITARNKEEFDDVHSIFINTELTDNPILFEVFTNNADESQALEMMLKIDANFNTGIKTSVHKIIGKKGVSFMKNILKK